MCRTRKGVGKPEEPNKPKLHISMDSFGDLNSSISTKDFTKDITTHVSGCIKKPRVMHLSTEKKIKILKGKKLMSKHKEPSQPVRGILKTQASVRHAQNSRKPLLPDSREADNCGKPQSSKHVTFSDEKDMIHQTTKSSPIDRVPELQSLCSLNTDNFSAHVVEIYGADVEDNILDVDGSEENNSSIIDHESDVNFTSVNLLSATENVIKRDFLKEPNDNQENLFDNYEVLDRGIQHTQNLLMHGRGCQSTSPGPPHACSSKFSYTLQDGCWLNPSLQSVGNSLAVPYKSGRLVNNLPDPGFKYPGLCSMRSVDISHEPSLPHPPDMHDNVNKVSLFPPSKVEENCNGNNLQYQSSRHLTPKELMNVICSLPDAKKKGVLSGEEVISEAFVRLPLNSQGEFINMNGNDKEKFASLVRPNAWTSPSSSLPLQGNIFFTRQGNFLEHGRLGKAILAKDEGESFTAKESLKENPYFHVPSTVGIIEYREPKSTTDSLDFRRGDCEFSNSVASVLSQVNCRYNKNGVFLPVGNHDRVSSSVTQPTMRLMGKEFAVDRRDSHGREGESFLADKLMTGHDHFTCAATNNCATVTHSYPELIWQTALAQGEGAPTWLPFSGTNGRFDAYPTMESPQTPQSRVLLPHRNSSKTSVVYEHGFGASHQSPISNLYPCRKSSTSAAPWNSDSIFQDHFVRGYEIPQVTSEASFEKYGWNKSSQKTYASSVTQKNQQKLPQASKSAFKFPFLHPASEEYVQSSRFHYTTNSMALWSSDDRCRDLLLENSQLCSNFGRDNDRCAFSGANLDTQPSAHLITQAHDCSNTLFTTFASSSSVSQGSFAVHPIMQFRTGFPPKFASATQFSDGLKLKGHVNSKNTSGAPCHCKTVKKRRAAHCDDSLRLIKSQNLGFQNDRRHPVTALRSKSNLKDDQNSCSVAFDTISDGEKPNAMDSLKAVDTVMSGSTKLAAGAKHILKPYQRADQNNSKTTNSALPFDAISSAINALESDKSTKIYLF